MNQPVYLDNNATTPLAPVVADAIESCLRSGLANPASQHSLGRRARRKLDDARDSIADQLEADQLIFTSGGTESNNLAVLGLAGDQRGPVITSRIEHPSVTEAFAELARRGFSVNHLRVLPDGRIDLEHLRELLSPQVCLVSVMAANHETGVLQPVQEVSRLCRETGVPFHCDASQAVGKIPVSFRQLDADAMTITPHKFRGPLGIGGLLLHQRSSLQPLLFGGPQQLALRPGTENVALAVGFEVAVSLCLSDLEPNSQWLAEQRDRFEQKLSASVPELVVHGKSAPRLPNTSNVAFPLNRQALLMALDLAGVACSTGSACASGSSEVSPVLLAMGVPKSLIEGSLRFSSGGQMEGREIDLAADRILSVVNDLCRQKHAKK